SRQPIHRWPRAIPHPHLVALLDEILGDARAHRAEANETDIHAASLQAEKGLSFESILALSNLKRYRSSAVVRDRGYYEAARMRIKKLCAAQSRTRFASARRCGSLNRRRSPTRPTGAGVCGSRRNQ